MRRPTSTISLRSCSSSKLTSTPLDFPSAALRHRAASALSASSDTVLALFPTLLRLPFDCRLPSAQFQDSSSSAYDLDRSIMTSGSLTELCRTGSCADNRCQDP